MTKTKVEAWNPADYRGCSPFQRFISRRYLGCFIGLFESSSPDQSKFAEAVGFMFQDPTDPQAELLRYLRTKKALLVQDNAEHLLKGVGVFTEFLKGCQQIKLLVTSRERLNMLIEWVFKIQGLPVPTNEQGKQFTEYISVALFLQSARRVRSGFEIRDDERQWAQAFSNSS